MAYTPYKRENRVHVKGILTEADLLNWWDISLDILNKLRTKEQLPYVSITKTNRLYFVGDLVQWLRKRQKVYVKPSWEGKKPARPKRKTNVVNIPVGWSKHEKSIARRDGYKCQRCKAKNELSIHHITPRSEGGSDDSRNLITLCKKCHDYIEANCIRSWDGIHGL